jgi:hypothetical protein
VLEALALVTWWGMGRIVRGLRIGQRSGVSAAATPAGSSDPVRTA